jgi:dihydroorotate dehydrogenase (fumarate)
MIDLSTTYLGLKLKNPLVASSSPLAKDLANIKKFEDAGVSAIVLHSLFEEQINAESLELDRFLSSQTESYAEALNYFPDMTRYNIGPDAYLEHIQKCKETVRIPIIASLNGVSAGGWVRYARLMQEAGADALELNIYLLPTDAEVSGEKIEQNYVDLVRHVMANVRIPVAVKFGPYFSSIPNFCRKLDQTGVDGLVMFNRFYQPDFDLETLEVKPNLFLSDSNTLLLRLHWVALLHGHIRADMAVTGGVHTVYGLLKSMMAGAKVAMSTSCLLRYGIDYAAQIIQDLREWMEEHEYESIQQMQGSMSVKHVTNAGVFERANYMKVLSSYVHPEPHRL